MPRFYKAYPLPKSIKRYKCSCCGGEYLSDRSDEEAWAEKDLLFPEHDDSECGVVCDDCFNRIMAELKN